MGHPEDLEEVHSGEDTICLYQMSYQAERDEESFGEWEVAAAE